MMALLNDCPLATDPRGPSWLEQSIDAAARPGCEGDPGGLLRQRRPARTRRPGQGGRRRFGRQPPRRPPRRGPRTPASSSASRTTWTAEQNARILDRIGHDSVKIYYDCYNSGGTKGYDVPAEIRFLKDRIAQFHFKNGPDFLDDRQAALRADRRGDQGDRLPRLDRARDLEPHRRRRRRREAERRIHSQAVRVKESS